MNDSYNLNLSWCDVNVVHQPYTFLPAFLSKNNQGKQILKNQYGKVLCGELIGLLGSSGSGNISYVIIF
jgi:hypothetical protein